MPGSSRQQIPAEFEYLEGKGYRFFGGGRSVLMRALALTKEGEYLDNLELLEAVAALQEWTDGIDDEEALAGVPLRVFFHRDFRKYNSTYVYKCISEETYVRFVSKGSFLVSSLARFRDFERARDI